MLTSADVEKEVTFNAVAATTTVVVLGTVIRQRQLPDTFDMSNVIDKDPQKRGVSVSAQEDILEIITLVRKTCSATV